VGLIRRASVASGNGTAFIVGCGATALFDQHTTHFPANFAPHISLSINGFVTETIVFFCVTYGWRWHFPLCVLAFMVLIAQISTFSSDFFH
ncbi:hypothetical protein LZG91_003578, partial [Shigella sonnei]|nr:hypothetical protein [Shigella sonnei]